VTLTPPEFSVVIPAFNAEATIASSVASVLGQTRTDVEVVVIDDGSTDGTVAAVERIADQRVRLIVQPNTGVSTARNAGIASAGGRYIAFLDSDDLWLPRYLELASKALASTARPGFAYTDAYAFDPVTGKVGRRGMVGRNPPVPPPTDRGEFLLELLERNFVHASATVPRQVIDDVGGFDPAAAPAEDYGLWLRIAVSGYDVAWIPGKHALYRIHAGQASRNELKLRRGEAAALRTIDPTALPTPRHRALLDRRRSKIERELRVLEGGAHLAGAVRRVRRRVGRVRQAVGLGSSCRENPPAEVAAAFPDLTAV
jgi:glycosyltransferase involved in cell wall biosynthesis